MARRYRWRRMVDGRFGQAGVSPRGNQSRCNSIAPHLCLDPMRECASRGVREKCGAQMTWCGGVDDGLRPILCRSLEALLQRDRSFAQSFVRDRRALQRIIKLVAQETDAKQPQHCSRLERSAGLHCVVLAFRLARIDEFAAEVFLPILIAGSLSGVVQYRPGSRHEGRERQHDPAGAQPPSAYSSAHEAQLKNISDSSSLWPSTTLSSAQELAAHAVVNPMLEAIEDGAQSLLEALEAASSPTTSRREEEQEEHTVKPTTSTMTARSTNAAADDHPLRDDSQTRCSMTVDVRRRQNKASRFAFGGDDGFDDPATCGTFALRRLCLCGLGFALLPPASGAASEATVAAKRRQLKMTTGGAGNPNPAIVPAIVETLVVLAHGEFLHPDAAVLADFLNHGQDQDTPKRNTTFSRDQHQHRQGEPPAAQADGSGPVAGAAASPPPTAMPAASSADVQSSTASVSSAGSTTRNVPNDGGSGGGGGGGGRRDDRLVKVKAEGRAGGGGGGEGIVVQASRRGTNGTCMICAGKGPTAGGPSSPAGSAMSRGVASLRCLARLLLAQISVSDLQKAQARSFGYAKRRARIAAAIEENRPPPAVNRSGSLNSRITTGGKAGGVGTLLRDDGTDDDATNVLDVTPGAAGQPEGAEVGPGKPNRPSKRDRTKSGKQMMPASPPVFSRPTLPPEDYCLGCRRVVLGHPLDVISYRCGKGDQHLIKGDQHLAAGEAAEVARTAGMGGALALHVVPVAGADERYLVKRAGFGDQPKSAVEAGSSGAGSGGGRRGTRNGGVGAAAVSEALGDKAVETVAEQLGSAIKGRRFEHDASVEKLAEAHARGKEAKEVKLDRKVDFRRRLAAAASEAHQEIETVALRRQLLRGGLPSSRKSRTGGGGGGGGDAVAPPLARRVKAATGDPGQGLGDGSKWDENGDMIEPDPATIATAATASAAAVTAESLARWNQRQKQEQEQRLQQLIVEMKDAVDGGEGGDVRRCRPTLRRGSGSGSVDSRRSGSRVSISGSGIYRDLAQGVDASHAAILSSMRADGVDPRAYLDDRRTAFRDVVEEQKNAFLTLPVDSEPARSGLGSSTAGGSTDWETTEENAMNALLGGAGRPSSRNSTRSDSPGGDSSANTSTTGGRGGRDDESAETTDEEAAAGLKAQAVARDAEQLRLARARRAAREERIEIEKREAIEVERGARRRAKDRAEAARAERKAKASAHREVQRRREALDREEEEARIERETGQEERMNAAAVEKKRQAKLRRAREIENRKQATLEQARHEEEMARIERWRQQERERKLEIAKEEEEAQRAAEAKRAAELEAISREEERRRADVETKRLALKEEREVTAARLKRGEFRYIRGKLVFREAKGALLMAANNRG